MTSQSAAQYSEERKICYLLDSIFKLVLYGDLPLPRSHPQKPMFPPLLIQNDSQTFEVFDATKSGITMDIPLRRFTPTQVSEHTHIENPLVNLVARLRSHKIVPQT
jgi:hypothetical protein